MSPKRLVVACFLACVTFGRAEIQWTQAIITPGPTPGSVDQLERDEKGSLYAVIREAGEKQVWKWNSTGQKQFEAPIDGDRIVLGTHGDFFVFDSSSFSRHSRETGSRVWGQSISNIDKLSVDESGQPYLQIDTYGNARYLKRSYVTGNPVWTAIGRDAVMMQGPNLLLRTPTRLQLVSKSTGQVVKEIEQPVAGAVEGAPIVGGGALLRFTWTTPYLYGLRPDGTLVSLGLANGGLLVGPDGTALVRSNDSLTRYGANFAQIWTRNTPLAVSAVDANTIYAVKGSAVERLRLSDGQSLSSLQLPQPSSYVPPVRDHSGHVVFGGSDSEGRARLLTYDAVSGNLIDQWHSSSEGRPSSELVTAATLPNGDLIVVTNCPDVATVMRFSAQGQLTWMTTTPYLGQILSIRDMYGAWIDVDPNGTAISVTFEGHLGTRSIEVDATSGAIKQLWPGYLLVRGNAEYRTFYRGNTEYTSKFDRSTDRELWRIPRAGRLLLDGKGNLYAGRWKNRESDGNRLWGSAGEIILGVHDGRAYFIQHAGGTVAADEKSGQTLWFGNTNNYQRSDHNQSAGIEFEGNVVTFRQTGAADGEAFYVSNGTRAYFGGESSNLARIGVATANGYLRPSYVSEGQWDLGRSSGFMDLSETSLARLPLEPGLMLATPTGGVYMVGPDQTGRLVVSRWQD